MNEEGDQHDGVALLADAANYAQESNQKQMSEMKTELFEFALLSPIACILSHLPRSRKSFATHDFYQAMSPDRTIPCKSYQSSHQSLQIINLVSY